METKPVIWTKERITQELEFILNELRTDDQIISLGDIFSKLDYSQQRFCEWANKYADISDKENYDEVISESYKKIKEMLEARIVKGATFNKMNPTFSIFNLKNNYGWKDKSEVDNNVNIQDTNDILNRLNGK